MEPNRSFQATFAPIAGTRGGFALTVYSDVFPNGGRVPLARVGNQTVQVIRPIIGGGGFTGRLERSPSEGDRLYVGYVGDLEVPTTAVYHSGAAPRVS